MLVIPVEQSILYVQPLYLRATSVENALPELQRVIVATNERVVMRETLEEAIAAVVSDEAAVTSPIETTTETTADDTTGAPTDASATPAAEPAVTSGVNDLAQQAIDLFDAGQQALADGDWAAYGAAQDELQIVLQQLAEASAAGLAATPVP